MSPLPIHEHAVKYFTDCTRMLLAPHQSPQVQVSHLPNSKLRGEEGRDVIPDVRLDIEPRYGAFGPPITVWVGECGYSQSRQSMQRKLLLMADNSPSINAVFMIALKDSKPCFPRQHRLLSEPPLTMSDFTGPLNRPLTALTEVKVGDVVWCAIQLVEFFVFVRGSDGEFDFEVSEENPLAAHGVLHPNIEMESIAPLLNTASRQLFIAIANIMEAHDDQDHSNLRNAAETVTFPIDWNVFLEHIQGSLYQTAFHRYNTWRHKEPKDLPAGPKKRSNRRRK